MHQPALVARQLLLPVSQLLALFDLAQQFFNLLGLFQRRETIFHALAEQLDLRLGDGFVALRTVLKPVEGGGGMTIAVRCLRVGCFCLRARTPALRDQQVRLRLRLHQLFLQLE